MIDVDLQLSVSDEHRRFDLAVRFVTDVPFAALYGPSGSGKSLTLQAIAGLLRPARGHVRLDGRTLYDSAAGIDLAPAARRIGYLFQDYALFPHLTVFDNVAFGLTSAWRPRLAAADRARVDDLLASFGLAEVARSRPRHLSGGQRQRVALARALACEPQVLLLDEPFAALNPMLRSDLRRDLADVRRRRGIPALMITHDIEDVLELADAAFIYDDGRVERQIDLRTGESRTSALQEFIPNIASETPVRARVRRLLLG
ncbi:sulfate/molybdate ABC transporter ATP-binding protein [Xylophilus sp. GOD-11R]|uniref:sulfate/molybdate ABC transporter ATP-binding protein n=1 Tax=Xylophilus sp. GOD-11R TaxID=3089814 RepID=UPI00298BE1BD|nr:ATP-binding cassette domain-containing protein [Xylophilus sp. GOD-11R]WPB56689.1 ATP-binding cassette domain-containing protein [Xylophilus sp. GOD-11R]